MHNILFTLNKLVFANHSLAVVDLLFWQGPKCSFASLGDQKHHPGWEERNDYQHCTQPQSTEIDLQPGVKVGIWRKGNP